MTDSFDPLPAAPDPAPAVDVDGLVKIFRDFWRRPKVRAVDGLNLRIGKGEVFGLLGPNGSGKSTTLKVLLGLLRPTAGTVRVLGRPPRDIRARRETGYLPEETWLYPFLTPRETLMFFGSLFDLDGATRRERTGQLLEMVGLQEAARRPVGEFSKGMARRVGLAQALINDPRLVLLDEPTSGLDPVACRRMKDLIRALAGRGKTVILSSHLLADVEDVCDRIGILFRGRLRALGPVRELLRKEDQLQMTLPVLPPDRLRELLARVREMAGGEPDVRHPSVTLERFFLDVVAQAHEAPAEGDSASAVAPYLRGA
ncbi:MAG: ABC transporter ATP-binding protein [Lentisphaerae bacterium]|nr:ABC transporter ATP-binding protein [Lentisphaerota bacterium]